MPDVRAFTDSIRCGDVDRAVALIDSLPDVLPDHALRALADLEMFRQRWADAAKALGRMRHRDANSELRRRLCGNLDALQDHRPEVYAALIATTADETFSIGASASGHPTIFQRLADGRSMSLSAGNQPVAAVAASKVAIGPTLTNGATIGLAGIGDGYLLLELAANPPKLFMTKQQAIVFIEPDLRLLFVALMLHDFTGTTGPIEQQRVRWYAGDDWAKQMSAELVTDAMTPYPALTVKLGTQSEEISAGLRVMGDAIVAREETFTREIERLGSEASASAFLLRAIDGSDRRPRVLLFTTRFSTVLQYSTADAAAAFRELGWDVFTLIEPTDWQPMSRLAMRRALADFKPDLIFQIDHLRAEHAEIMPRNVPFVCWVQDNLPNLTTREAGRKVDDRQFVLIPSAQRYVDAYDYPARQCLEFRKLSREVSIPQMWTSDGPEMMYVSNWSQTPEAMAGEVTRLLAKIAPPTLIESTCHRMISLYARGDSLPTQGDVRRVLEGAQDEMGIARFEPARQRACVLPLFERMNNVLFRQQGLKWAAEVAERRGWRLAIHGNGWEKHADFAKFAAGPIAYGQPLEAATRSAKVNLLLEPYMCLTHQRLLDGLLAGGFFLMRDHPTHALVQAMIDLLSSDSMRGAETADEVYRRLDVCGQLAFDRLLVEIDAADASPGLVDPITTIRRLQAGRFLGEIGEVLPKLSAVSFSNPATMDQTMSRFIEDAPARQAIREQQRAFVADRFSYVAGMRYVVDFVRARLREELQPSIRAA